MSVSGRKIILAVTGSIAAYKTPVLVRLLVKAGAEVRVVITQSAGDFVTPLALSTVSKHPVLTSVHDGSAWNNHVELGLWADAMLVAPCSANTLAKLANGLCDSLVAAVYLSARCPVFIAPAMDEDMWKHPSTKANVERLKSYGNHLVPVAHGELASGLIGEGRMAEPEELVAFLTAHFDGKPLPVAAPVNGASIASVPVPADTVQAAAAEAARVRGPLGGKKALVTAGPTYEKLDPVRFIGNYSSGKMGVAIADALAAAGAEVLLVQGPSTAKATNLGVKTVHVESAQEMHAACMAAFKECTVAVMAAAVADYRPSEQQASKIKKTSKPLSLELVKTPDILMSLGDESKATQYLVGFALETDNEEANAKEKLLRKGADLMVLNSLRDEGAGFGGDTNKVTFVTRDSVEPLPLLSKAEVAQAIVSKITKWHHELQTV
jgi:phosphopantothenoylcysteine decarboxylase/phosphopantothenate--cysteine ligase